MDLLVQETHLNDSHLSECFSIPRYRFHGADRTCNSGKSRGGGLAVYAGSKYHFEYIESHTKCNKDIEIMWVRLDLPSTRSTLIANIYRPPDGNLSNALEIIEKDIAEWMSTGNPDIVIMGDFNVDVHKNHAANRKLNLFISNNSLSQIITEPTQLTNTSKSTIDLALVNNDDFYVQQGSIDLGLTNHCMIYTSRRLKPKSKLSYIISRSYRDFDEMLFYISMKNETWTRVYQCQDPDLAAEAFTNIFRNIADIRAPFKKIKCISRQAKWVTPEFLSLIDEKHHLCHVYNKHPTTYNAARKREAVRRVKRMMRVLK